jgi:hypothetical protein
MAKISIEKKITLEFLGEKYKDDYLVFSSIALREYEKLLPELEAAGDNGQKSLAIIKKVLEDHFIEGKFQNEDVIKDDLADFDLETLTHCFELFTGQVPPKDGD